MLKAFREETMARRSDRVLILKQGRIIRELSRDGGDEITEAKLIEAIQM